MDQFLCASLFPRPLLVCSGYINSHSICGRESIGGGTRDTRSIRRRPLLLRRPKAVFFGAQAEKPRLFYFFRRRLVMVFGGQITFRPPPKKIRPPILFRGPPKMFFGPTNVLRVFVRGTVKCARQGPRKMKTPPSPHICSNIEGGGGGEGGGGRGRGEP